MTDGVSLEPEKLKKCDHCSEMFEELALQICGNQHPLGYCVDCMAKMMRFLSLRTAHGEMFNQNLAAVLSEVTDAATKKKGGA